LVQETREHGVGVPFILLTAETSLAIRQRAADMGVVAVLNKPVRKHRLLDHVGQALSTSRLHGIVPHAESHQRCTARCTFSIGGFCSLLTRDISH
jgi:FixJ family two-component response regulator